MIKEKILERILNYVTVNYNKLDKSDFVIGEIPYNFRCHLNSVQKVKEGKAAKVFLCIAIQKSDSTIIVHFINQLDDGKYIDHTWGWIHEFYDYYIIKEVVESEFSTIGKVLESAKYALINGNSNWLERKISRTDLGSI